MTPRTSWDTSASVKIALNGSSATADGQGITVQVDRAEIGDESGPVTLLALLVEIPRSPSISLLLTAIGYQLLADH